MTDLLYMLGSVAFFALMIAYVKWCESLGKKSLKADEGPTP